MRTTIRLLGALAEAVVVLEAGEQAVAPGEGVVERRGLLKASKLEHPKALQRDGSSLPLRNGRDFRSQARLYQ